MTAGLRRRGKDTRRMWPGQGNTGLSIDGATAAQATYCTQSTRLLHLLWDLGPWDPSILSEEIGAVIVSYVRWVLMIALRY